MLIENKDITLEGIFSAPTIIEQGGMAELTRRKTIREKIVRLEEQLMKMEGDQIEIETNHHFSNGIYAREVFIPKGTLLTGKIHKTEHLNILSKGDVSVLTEFGADRHEGHKTFISQPWTKRVVYAHEDSIWTVLHATNETDLEKIEDLVIARNYDELDKLEAKELLVIESKGE